MKLGLFFVWTTALLNIFLYDFLCCFKYNIDWREPPLEEVLQKSSGDISEIHPPKKKRVIFSCVDLTELQFLQQDKNIFEMDTLNSVEIIVAMRRWDDVFRSCSFAKVNCFQNMQEC